MRKHRKLLISALLLATVAAVGLVFYYRSTQPPGAARLLPEGDFIFYANLKPVHLFNLNQSGPVQLEGEYKDFIAQTGIQFERDLDEVAMSRRDTADHRDVESAEIFAGRFDPERLQSYLGKAAGSTEQYRGHAIYSIAHEGHLVRVCLLDRSRVAVTNMPSPEPMHGIIDRNDKPAPGPWLLAAHYRDVPATSIAWLIDRIPNKADSVQLPGGFSFSFPADSVAVASLRYTGSLLFRADIFAQSEAQAREIVDSANTHLSLARSIGQWMGSRGPDKDIKAAFESIRVEQKENVAVFTATIPQSVLKKFWSEAQSESAAPVYPAPQSPGGPGPGQKR
jgi:hypothetical protein